MLISQSKKKICQTKSLGSMKREIQKKTFRTPEGHIIEAVFNPNHVSWRNLQKKMSTGVTPIMSFYNRVYNGQWVEVKNESTETK